jgi:hypothetical protein
VVVDSSGSPVAAKKMMITVSPPGTASTTSGAVSSTDGTGQGSLRLITSSNGSSMSTTSGLMSSNGNSIMASTGASSTIGVAAATTGTSTGSASQTSSASATVPPSSPSAAAGSALMSIRLVGSTNMFDIRGGANGGSDATVSIRKLTLGGSNGPGSPVSPNRTSNGLILSDGLPRHRPSISQPPLPIGGSNKLLLGLSSTTNRNNSPSPTMTTTTIGVGNSASVARGGLVIATPDSPFRPHSNGSSATPSSRMTKGEELLIQKDGLNVRRPSIGRLGGAGDLVGPIPGQADSTTDGTSPAVSPNHPVGTYTSSVSSIHHQRVGSTSHSRIGSTLPPLQTGRNTAYRGTISGSLHERTSTLGRSPLSGSGGASTPVNGTMGSMDDDLRRRSREVKRRTMDNKNMLATAAAMLDEKKVATPVMPTISDAERRVRMDDITARIRAIPIPPKPIDLKNEVEFKAFVERREQFQQLLQELHDISPKMPIMPLPKNLDKLRPFLSSTFRDFNEERNMCFKTAFPKVTSISNQTD